jgi:hypothetical protein
MSAATPRNKTGPDGRHVTYGVGRPMMMMMHRLAPKRRVMPTMAARGEVPLEQLRREIAAGYAWFWAGRQ